MGSIFSNAGLFTFLLLLAVPLGYIALQVRALRAWQGRWREAAQWSAWTMKGLTGWMILSFVIGSANGLLPLLFAMPIAAGYMLGLTAAHRIVHGTSV